MTFKAIHLGTDVYQQALRLRESALRTPLGLTLSGKELTDDSHCYHLGGFDRDQLRAVLLLQPLNKEIVKMRQVAVDPALQNLGIGSQLVTFAETFAKEHGFTEIVAHARGTAVGFYRKVGYRVCGEEFIELTIPHRLVRKEI